MLVVLQVRIVYSEDDQYAKIIADTSFSMKVTELGPEFSLHYTVVRNDSDGTSASAYIEIMKPQSDVVLQQWADTIEFDWPYISFSDAPEIIDINFDGYRDICFEGFMSFMDPSAQLRNFRQFNPQTSRFEPATQFDSLQGSLTFMEDSTIEAYAPMGGMDQYYIIDTYKYNGMKLEFVKQAERLMGSNGKRILIEREKVNGVLKDVSVSDDE